MKTAGRQKRPSSSSSPSCSMGNNNNTFVVVKNESTPKKSLRLIFKKCKNTTAAEQSKKSKKVNWNWPRTVEAAQDPFNDATGKNKMFYLIAINLYPESKILQPSDSESDDEEQQQQQSSSNVSEIRSPNRTNNNTNNDDDDDNAIFGSPPSPSPPRRARKGRRQTKRRAGTGAEADLSWRTEYNRQRRNKQQGQKVRLADKDLILEVIDSVVGRYSQNLYPPPVNVIKELTPEGDTDKEN